MEDRAFRDEMKKDGYSKEEKYFYKRNQELIERQRKEDGIKVLKNQPSMLKVKSGERGVESRTESLGREEYPHHPPRCEDEYIAERLKRYEFDFQDTSDQNSLNIVKVPKLGRGKKLLKNIAQFFYRRWGG